MYKKSSHIYQQIGGDSGFSPDFRLFITTEPHHKFSIGLLQMSIKVCYVYI
jgi:hypothetical protein